LASDRSKLSTGWDDVAYVTATVVDDKGVLVPGASAKIAFSVSGPGTLIAVDNADISSIEPFQAPERQVFDGQCIAILRAASPGGRITLKASADGLTAGSVQLETSARTDTTGGK
jgi:beta-galactosidase